jgi:hypothetical protein
MMLSFASTAGGEEGVGVGVHIGPKSTVFLHTHLFTPFLVFKAKRIFKSNLAYIGMQCLYVLLPFILVFIKADAQHSLGGENDIELTSEVLSSLAKT